ncbi:DNA polymerase III subunit gamma and tau [Microbacterium marinilacus]|uniref:DNA-directed DNA polymerase n=1 Tax=Microbacterium marinilacus TaxID=415209 RepID=A0ABP7BD17_9MICO|nr:DNA polymerase III subunit gamma and tau [Microbacterium marinilacus]MBY0689296.1 DNA polymerase III subunit gamma and tau [Microbacterium marinilacus]
MTTALYRRYRPETFGEMIGQSQVTEPLMTALRGDRIGHAYLFSGPRGCGKTTSARILARCLNCAEGPTDTPCGTCDSCVELSRAGGGSLDVVEIDAASHNGVDDARDLRERAVFAPARDRFKIFILDEAHMVTPQGFNALLKLVEEPPAHVKFIFATTEPDKVIGTIRSRTHHYPFRLVPPAAMLDYVQALCEQEGVQVENGVLPLVVRAGGGSPRDTLSILDQLIAGSENGRVSYERAVALLGYTHGELLDGVIDAFASGDAGSAFGSVDRVVQTGQDPRRFVDDLLERLRDLIVIAATGQGASAVLRGIPADELQRMAGQAQRLGAERLSKTADIVSAALDAMTGATSPRLQLELMIARVLAGALAPQAGATPGAAPVPAAEPPAATSARGAAAPAASAPAPAASAPAASAPEAPAPEKVPAPAAAESRPAPSAPATPPTASTPPVAEPAERPEPAPASADSDTVPAAGWATVAPGSAPAAPTPAVADAPAAAKPPASPEQTSTPPAPTPGPEPEPAPAPEPAGPLTLDGIGAAWDEVLGRLQAIGKQSWLVVSGARVIDVRPDDVLVLGFPNERDLATFKTRTPQGGVSEDLRTAISAVLGVRVKYLAHLDANGRESGGRDGGADGSARPAAEPAATDPDPARQADAAPRPYDDAPPEPDYPGDPYAGEQYPPDDAYPAARTAPAPQRSAAPPQAPRPEPQRSSAPASYAAAPVTEWAVAPIPNSEATPPLAVDDDPEEAAVPVAARVATLERDGAVMPTEVPVDADEEPDDQDDQDGGPADVAPAAPSVPLSTVTVQRRVIQTDGVQRYGEAVVRQILEARFLHEEPYEPPTRFQ